MKDINMYCPCCGDKLISTGTFYYEDCCECKIHSNKYQCSNEDCACHVFDCVWNDDGTFFSHKMKYKRIRMIFPNDEYAALNSFDKRMEVDIYKKGLKKEIILHPIFCLFLLKPVIEFVYKGDDWGNVISRRFKLKFLKYDKSMKSYCIYYTSGIHMLIFCLKGFFRLLNNYKNEPTKFNVKELIECFEKHKWNDSWYKRTERFILNMFYSKLKKEIFIMKEIFDMIDHKTLNLIKNNIDIKLHEPKRLLGFLKSLNPEFLTKLKEISI